jgi:hypothetical protein
MGSTPTGDIYVTLYVRPQHVSRFDLKIERNGLMSQL